ncbi:MAG: hypothetical protein Q8O99_05685 [bacterium]|nr:hypothetical protein [bacterium]
MIGFTDLTTEEEEKTPLLKFLRQGKGDCDKYASLYRLCRTYFQELFPERVDIQNIYIGNKRYGGDKRKGHARNSIIYFTQDQVVVSHIDPTFADTMDGEYQAADSYHLSAYPELRLARFYRASGDKVAANYFYDLTERNYELDEETKRRISSER